MINSDMLVPWNLLESAFQHPHINVNLKLITRKFLKTDFAFPLCKEGKSSYDTFFYEC